jgi:hypothetical protein
MEANNAAVALVVSQLKPICLRVLASEANASRDLATALKTSCAQHIVTPDLLAYASVPIFHTLRFPQSTSSQIDASISGLLSLLRFAPAARNHDVAGSVYTQTLLAMMPLLASVMESGNATGKSAESATGAKARTQTEESERTANGSEGGHGRPQLVAAVVSEECLHDCVLCLLTMFLYPMTMATATAMTSTENGSEETLVVSLDCFVLFCYCFCFFSAFGQC